MNTAPPGASRAAPLATIGAAIAIAVWLAATAVYRADDYVVIADAWAGGSFGEGVRRWWDTHFVSGVGEAWPRFYRPTWRALLLVDAHLFRGCAAGSALLSWGLHVVVAWHVGRLVFTATGAPRWRWLATWWCLLPGAAVQAALWVSARGTLLATLATVLALRVLLAEAPRSARHHAVVAALVMVAATSNEVGILAIPLVAVAALCRGGDARRTRIAAAATVAIAGAVLLAWRRAMVGDWIGGYAPASELAAQWPHLPTTVLAAAGAVALPGHGPITGAVLLVAGAAAFVALFAAMRLASPRARAVLALGVATMVLCALPFAGNRFRAGDDENSRSLYSVHAGWLFAAFVALHAWGSRRRAPRGAEVAELAAAALAAVAAVAFVVTALAYQRALTTTRSLIASLARLADEPLAVALGLPDHANGFFVARNALPAALLPPFRDAPKGTLGWLTDADFAAGTLRGLASVFAQLPAASVWRWDASGERMVPGWSTAPSRFRGAVAIDADGAVRCGGVPLVLEAGAPRPTAGSWCEVLGDVAGDGGAPSLRVHTIAAWQPLLRRGDDGTWHYRGKAGDWVFVLVGDAPCCVGLGAAGSLGVAKPVTLPGAVADGAGACSFALPAAAAGAVRLQAMVLRGIASQAEFGEVHELR